MKNYFTFLFLLLCMPSIYSNTFYHQLCEFNFNWKKYKEFAPEGKAYYFNSDKEYIQAHLSSVLPILENNPIDQLDINQYRSRLALIDILRDYKNAGNFPINYYRQERIPVFIDEHHTHCAVGYLLKETGHGDLAFEISKINNYAWIKDIHHLGFEEWQQESGLTLEELKLIQGAYDFYRHDAMLLANRYEIPQKPEVMTIYFNPNFNKKYTVENKDQVWCYGEGENGLLNGLWIQNYAEGVPWIEGYFDHGKRTGQWKEYYQGTDKLCRTENWRNDKLNGVRKRFDRNGNLIEEILFKNGKAITKTNYDLGASLKWVRKPLDSILMHTQIYTLGGALLAEGNEKVHNPGNLLWFQNIELTALNSASITSRNVAVSSEAFYGNGSNIIRIGGRQNLYNSPPLVEYKKEGKWIYYKNISQNYFSAYSSDSFYGRLKKNYIHFADDLIRSIRAFNDFESKQVFDSIQAVYSEDRLEEFYGFGKKEILHLGIRYHNDQLISIVDLNPFLEHRRNRSQTQQQPRIKEVGRYNQYHQKIGEWKHFDKNGRLFKTENFIVPFPWREEDLTELDRIRVTALVRLED